MLNTYNPIIKGFLKIIDFDTKEVLVDKENAINYEAMSLSMARTLADFSDSNQRLGYIYGMAFGNGASSVDPTGVITYLPPNVTGLNAALYDETYLKVVDQNIVSNADPSDNYMKILHTSGNLYSDVVVSCMLDYGEPAGQQAYDNSTNYNGQYVFDEIGLKAWNGSTDNLMLITHVVFHPIQKSLNRRLQINYTLRISALTTITGC